SSTTGSGSGEDRSRNSRVFVAPSERIAMAVITGAAGIQAAAIRIARRSAMRLVPRSVEETASVLRKRIKVLTAWVRAENQRHAFILIAASACVYNGPRLQ